MDLRSNLPKVYPERVFAIFQDCDLYGDLIVHVGYEKHDLRLFVLCNDLFDPACGDMERITEDEMPLLLQTAQDLLSIDSEEYLPDLFVARARKRQPLAYWMKKYPDEVRALFEKLPPN